MAQLNNLPSNLPKPVDDGACDHLKSMKLPKVTLSTTSNNRVNLSQLKGLTVLYFYPMTGRPDVDLPQGWDEIPGARGCTPQSCSFRDNNQLLKNLKAKVYGISTQSTAYQKEMVERLHLPFEALSDESLELTKALNLPTLSVDGMRLIKRITLICQDNEIIKVFYPVFPPDKNVEEVISWIANHKSN